MVGRDEVRPLDQDAEVQLGRRARTADFEPVERARSTSPISAQGLATKEQRGRFDLGEPG